MWVRIQILQRFARTFLHASLRYRTRLETFEASDTGVIAERGRPAEEMAAPVSLLLL